MNLILSTIFFFFYISRCFGLQLCTDSTAPVTLKAPLGFCAYNGSSCCSAKTDSDLKKQFQSLNISDSGCASLVQSILCAKCDPFSASLFTIGPKVRTVPLLCNSTPSATPSRNKTSDFCAQVWETCKNTPIKNSPFAPIHSPSALKLTDLWQSKSDFCNAFGGLSNNDTLCFTGTSVNFNTTEDTPKPKGLCIEKLANGTYLNMAAHPDGSSRVFLANQKGKVWLANVPEQGSGGKLDFDESSPFLDVTDQVFFDSQFGVMGLAFHPDFANNGRLFVSFTCDKSRSTSCNGRCSCNSDVGCDPSKLGSDNGVPPCQYQSVIVEFSTNGVSNEPSKATSASASEIRRIFTMGLPFTSHHGGQILFGPEDGYMYYMMGDGGRKGDPFNFSQNKKSLLGKIMRIDVDKVPSQKETEELNLWGNYSIPKDNPSVNDKDLQPEIWALGMRNPWRCSFDSARPSYFICADVGEDEYEEVDLITKGGNYGWRVFEGPEAYKPPSTPGGNTSANSINPILPVMGYTHSGLNNTARSASITGGYVYRSETDPCMIGRYLYADLYAGAMWAGTQTPQNSGNYSSKIIPFGCSKESPMPCEKVPGSESTPLLGYIFSFGEDNSKDVFLLTGKGVYRVVGPSKCGYSCPKEKVSEGNNVTPVSPSSSVRGRKKAALELNFMFLFVLFMVVGVILG